MEKIQIFFVLIISLLLLHEMDAVRKKEWKMFIVLKHMVDETAYQLFAIIHLPLYIVVFYIIGGGITSANTILYYIVDIFLVFHGFLHFGFRRNSNNGFTSVYSKTVISLMSVMAAIHLFL